MVESDPCQKAKHLTHRSLFNSAVTSGHVPWPVTKRTKAWVRAAKMSFLYWLAELRLGGTDGEELGVKLLLLLCPMAQVGTVI